SVDELIGQRFVTIVWPDDVDETLAAIEETKKTNSRSTFENCLRKKDGSPVNLLWSWSWSTSDQMLFGVAHDITRRKKLEQLKKEFVAMVSHDLRTPLTSFQCFLEGFAAGVYDKSIEQAKKRAGNAQADIARLINLVTSLLDLEKMEEGKMEIVA